MTAPVGARPGRRQVLGASVAGISSLALPGAAQAASVLGPSSAPSAPTITSAVPAGYRLTSGTANHGAIEVTWGAVAGATSYTVKYRPSGEGGAYTTFGTSTADTTLVVTGLDDDEAAEYDVVVVASSGGGASQDSLSESSRTLIAIGGTRVTTFLGDGAIGASGTRYVVHEFTTVGDSTLVVDRPGSLAVDHLVVGGGGAGGGDIAGGGGAGEFVETSGATLSAQGYTITVGGGGTGDGGDGGPSSAFGVTADGGGGGGRLGQGGRPGGSGGGAGALAGGSVGTSTADEGLGNVGGAGSASNTAGNTAVGGGGGGAGGAGQPAIGEAGGDGGLGSTSTLTGVEVAYAGGGGGGINSDDFFEPSRSDGPAGEGQAGGGMGGYWSGDPATHAGTAATANSGSGGGGSGNGGGGGAGGSGIVVLRYAIPDATA